MNVGSLFSGIGGIELGFERQGFRTEWFVENDRYARKILRKHWPGTVIHGDITRVDFRTVPKVEVITGGFPCQDISNAGKQAGIEGERSGLWKEFKRAIGEVRPRVAFIENVAALTHRGLDAVLADLAEIGYDAEWYCVQAADVGAWHRRERIFILAYPNDNGHVYGQTLQHTAETRQHAQRQSCPESADVPDTEGERHERFRAGREQEPGLHAEERLSLCRGKTIPDTDCRRLEKPGTEGRHERDAERVPGNGWWAAEPGLGRVANGVPDRVDRIRCLGNAVVPQVAEVFAAAIRQRFFE